MIVVADAVKEDSPPGIFIWRQDPLEKKFFLRRDTQRVGASNIEK
jgi:hypothetical protein